MIYIAGDKHGYKAMVVVEKYLESHNIEHKNLGVTREEEDMKLEQLIPDVVTGVLKDKDSLGILSCGTGVGVEVGANKFGDIRACLATDEVIAEWGRVYDNCNILCLAGWKCDEVFINKILDAWFLAKYDGSAQRLKMFETFSKWH